MNSWSSYPKVWNLGHPSVADIMLGDVIVEEKVDGSQFSFGLFVEDDPVNPGLFIEKLRVRSKGVEMNVDAPERMFAKAVETVRSLARELVPGWTYRAEFLQSPKHNALAYDRVPTGNLILFDITTGIEQYMDRASKEIEAKRLGLEIVPVLHIGRIYSEEKFRELLATDSILGGQKVEGVVVKNYTQFGKDGKPLFGKFVSESFREVHKGEWRKQNPTGGDILDELIVRYRTPARFAKAVQHLRDQGKLTGEPKDIGPLILEVQRDIETECAAEIMAALYTWAWPKVRRGISGGLPEWYKNELLNAQFAEQEEQIDG